MGSCRRSCCSLTTAYIHSYTESKICLCPPPGSPRSLTPGPHMAVAPVGDHQQKREQHEVITTEEPP